MWSRPLARLNERRYRRYTSPTQPHSNDDGQQMLMLTRMSVLGKKKATFFEIDCISMLYSLQPTEYSKANSKRRVPHQPIQIDLPRAF